MKKEHIRYRTNIERFDDYLPKRFAEFNCMWDFCLHNIDAMELPARKNIMDEIKCPKCNSNYYELLFLENDEICTVLYHGADYYSVVHKGVIPKALSKILKRPRRKK